MKMAAEELMADEAFATLILYFNAWENISEPEHKVKMQDEARYLKR